MADKYEVVKLEIAKLELKSGDILAIHVPEFPRDYEMKDIDKVLKEILPEGVKPLVFYGDIKLSVISKEDEK